WSHGDEEIISMENAIEWFNLDHVGKSAARFDFVKLTNLNSHYLREAENERLVTLVIPFIENKYGISVTTEARDLLRRGMTGLKQRAKTLVELADNSVFYITPQPLDESAQKILNEEGIEILKVMLSRLLCFPETSWTELGLEDYIRTIAGERSLNLTKATQPLRAALVGKTVSPSVFDVMHVLGKDRTIERLQAIFINRKDFS
ncbi:MAG TPA: glutamate--tRNA ligase, partial [Alphaproteobacteria bacterium]|nr:glutamate--tRNA ligase [Alphaproteobacteria bacterium]